MVQPLETRSDRLHRLLAEVVLPGEGGEQAHLAAQLEGAMSALDPGGEDLLLEVALTEVHLSRLGLVPLVHVDDLRASLLELLRVGALTPGLWGLIRLGILRYRGQPLGRARRWELEGLHIQGALGNLYEMGEAKLFDRLAETLAPLWREAEGDVELRFAHADAATVSRWSAALRPRLAAAAAACKFTPILLVV